MNGDLKTSLEDLSKHKLKAVISECHRVFKKKYKRCRKPKYGNINRGFTEAELRRFFSVLGNNKAFMAFQLQALLGLRIGEVVKVSAEDVDFHNNKIKVHTEKSGTVDFLPLHPRVRKLLLNWVQKYSRKIVKNGGYILFSDNPVYKRQHVSPGWLRNEFRKTCVLADLNQSYGLADDEKNQLFRKTGKHRRLFRLTTHSLRHYYITRVYKQTKNPVHTQRLARHKDFNTTNEVYIHVNEEELIQSMDKAFSDEGLGADDNDLADMIEFFKVWRQMKSKSRASQ